MLPPSRWLVLLAAVAVVSVPVPDPTTDPLLRFTRVTRVCSTCGSTLLSAPNAPAKTAKWQWSHQDRREVPTQPAPPVQPAESSEALVVVNASLGPPSEAMSAAGCAEMCEAAKVHDL